MAGDNVPGARRGGGTPVVPTIAQWSLVTTRVVNEPSQYSEKAPNRDLFPLQKFSLLRYWNGAGMWIGSEKIGRRVCRMEYFCKLQKCLKDT